MPRICEQIRTLRRKVFKQTLDPFLFLPNNCEPQIKKLEQSLGHRFPLVYRDFLRVFGDYNGKYLRGSDYSLALLGNLHSWACELLTECGLNTRMLDGAFVFFMHQGYQFSYFRWGEGDDPPVYYYFDGKECSMQIYPRLSDYFLAIADA